MTRTSPSVRSLFAVWVHIGATSFGGGSATQLLIHRHFVEKRRWLTPEEFSQVWAVVQFAPGINLLAIAVVMGKMLGGIRGAIASAIGMLLPSVGITIAMTALYALVQNQPRVAGALRGITPALVGLSIPFTWRLLKPPAQALRARGRAPLTLGLIVVGAALSLTLLGVPVLISYVLGAVVLGLFYARA